jgi:hypothetical protein
LVQMKVGLCRLYPSLLSHAPTLSHKILIHFKCKLNLWGGGGDVPVRIWRSRWEGSLWVATWLCMCDGSTGGGPHLPPRTPQPDTESNLKHMKIKLSLIISVFWSLNEWERERESACVFVVRWGGVGWGGAMFAVWSLIENVWFSRFPGLSLV